MTMSYMYTVELYPPINKNKIMTILKKLVELENIPLSEITQVQKDKYHVLSSNQKLDSKY